jgi:hypothetical protein
LGLAESEVCDLQQEFGLYMMGNIIVNEDSDLRLGHSLDFLFIIQVINSVPE